MYIPYMWDSEFFEVLPPLWPLQQSSSKSILHTLLWPAQAAQCNEVRPKPSRSFKTRRSATGERARNTST